VRWRDNSGRARRVNASLGGAQDVLPPLEPARLPANVLGTPDSLTTVAPLNSVGEEGDR
jgi:hypothetical protein